MQNHTFQSHAVSQMFGPGPIWARAHLGPAHLGLAHLGPAHLGPAHLGPGLARATNNSDKEFID